MTVTGLQQTVTGFDILLFNNLICESTRHYCIGWHKYYKDLQSIHVSEIF